MSAVVAEPAESPPTATWWPAVAVVVSGLAVGVATQILQGVLPDGWGVLANSGVMWALMAFALGATLPTPRWAAAGGAVQLVIAAIGYYLAVDWFEGHRSDPRGAIIWSAAGIVAGSMFGLGGHWFAHRAGWRYPVLTLVAGVLLGEGIRMIWFIGSPDLRTAGTIELVLAVIIASICLAGSLRSTLHRAPAITAGVTVSAAVVTLAASRIIDGVFAASW